MLNSHGTVNSPSRTAKQGSTISILVSGAGVTSPLEPVRVPFTYTFFFPFSTGTGNLLRVDATIPFVSASVLNGFTVNRAGGRCNIADDPALCHGSFELVRPASAHRSLR